MLKKKTSIISLAVNTFAILLGSILTLLLGPVFSKNSIVTADPNAIPTPIVPCLESEFRNPEFHSMRPYQASPCGDSPKTYFCNNDYKIGERVTMRWDETRCGEEGGNFYCRPEPNATVGGNSVFIIGGEDGKDYTITLGDAKFPIVGNTEGVFNSQSSTEQFDSSERMNEYVNWYLQGAIEKAEYGARYPLNFNGSAGPTKKLVPLDFLNFRRLGVLHDAGVHGKPYYSIDPSEYEGNCGEDPTCDGIDPETGQMMLDATGAHPQIAVCTLGGTAIPCYAGNGGRAAGSKHRLITWWEARGSTPSETFFNWTDNSVWSGITPPFPWQFTKEIYYRKSYAEWRGATCAILGGNLYCAFTGVVGQAAVGVACQAVGNGICNGLLSLIPPLQPYCIQNVSPLVAAVCEQAVISYGALWKTNKEQFCNNFYRDVSDSTNISNNDFLQEAAQVLCIDLFDTFFSINPVVSWSTNIWADMYKFIPLGNPSDKNAKHQVGGISAEAPGALSIVRVIDYTILKEPVLHYPHTQSTVEATNLLNQTHTPLECDENLEECNKIKGLGNRYEPVSCEFVDIRSNPGDTLTFAQGNVISRLVADNVMTMVEQIQCTNTGQLNTFFAPITEGGCGGRPSGGCEIVTCNITNCGQCGTLPSLCRNWPQCRAEVIVTIPTSPKIPFAAQLWKYTVADKTSAFRRIFPKIEPGAPVSCIADIPGRSGATFAAGDETNLLRINSAGPNTYPGCGPNCTALGALFFPQQGTVYEYFLRGIQTALRPQGFGNPIINGDMCDDRVCGELPQFPPVSADCSLRSTSVNGIQFPPSLANIIEAAAEAFNVPAQLMVGIMFGEGTFNPGRYDWTETNVINWATCEPLPNCTGPESSIVGFIPTYFEQTATRVLPELQKLDPTRTKVDACNLLDVMFVVSAFIHDAVGGGVDLAGKQCYGITMGSYNPQGCGEWYGASGDSMFETAIRGWEYGSYYDPTTATSLVCPVAGACNCATKPGGCAAGGFEGSACLTPGDGCETVSTGGTSHNACIWEVSHGQ